MRFREGWIGAVLDEYERALTQFKEVIKTLDEDSFKIQLDKETSDEDCVSIQSISTHTVNAGFGYSTYLRKAYTELTPERPRVEPQNIEEVIHSLDRMFEHTIETSEQLRLKSDKDLMLQFTVPWGQEYDCEQMFEHGITHVLRHRRQLEKFKQKYNI